MRRVVVGVLLGALGGALLGGGLGAVRGAPFVVPEPLDATRWNVVEPGRDENVATQDGRGTQVVGGAIVLSPHVFHRSDVVFPKDGRAIGAITLDLAPDSGPVDLRLGARAATIRVEVAPGAWRVLSGAWTPHAGPLVVRIAGGVARIGDTSIGAIEGATIELIAGERPVRLRGITLVDEAGVAFLVEDPVAAWAGRAPTVPGALLGALAGAAAAVSGLGGLVALAFPVGVALVPPGAWLALVERLYLVRLGPWELARAALVVAFVPLLVQLLARSGRAMPGEGSGRGAPRDPNQALLAWGGVAALATACAAWSGRGSEGWMWAPVGLGFLLAPLWLARGARLDPLGLLFRDLPAALSVGALGWGVGGLLAVGWRLALLVAGAGVLLRRAPRVAADAVFVAALAVLPAAELAARSTWLDAAWDAARLDGDAAWQDATPFWEGRCGGTPRATVLYVGGSSTGGAYQFQGEPDAFYPARVHARLCAAGAAVRTTNHGDGGRDSFTVSRSLPTLLAAEAPAVVVVYLGVNDLLTQESPLTRAQREAVEEGRGAATRGLAALGARSRLLTGLTLLARPRLDATAPVVSDVPLPDAEENLRRIAAAAHAAGAAVLFVPEHTAPDTARLVAPYAALEARLAAELPGVTYLDAGAALAPWAAEGLLVDRNHLSRAGSERLADVLAPVVAGLLGTAVPGAAGGAPPATPRTAVSSPPP